MDHSKSHQLSIKQRVLFVLKRHHDAKTGESISLREILDTVGNTCENRDQVNLYINKLIRQGHLSEANGGFAVIVGTLPRLSTQAETEYGKIKSGATMADILTKLSMISTTSPEKAEREINPEDKTEKSLDPHKKQSHHKHRPSPKSWHHGSSKSETTSHKHERQKPLNGDSRTWRTVKR